MRRDFVLKFARDHSVMKRKEGYKGRETVQVCRKDGTFMVQGMRKGVGCDQGEEGGESDLYRGDGWRLMVVSFGIRPICDWRDGWHWCAMSEGAEFVADGGWWRSRVLC